MHHGYHHFHSSNPHPVFWKRCLDWLMYCVAIATPIALIPQLLEVWVDKDVSGVSVATWSLLSVINIFWVIYGVAHKVKAVIISSVLMCTFNFLVALGALIFQ